MAQKDLANNVMDQNRILARVVSIPPTPVAAQAGPALVISLAAESDLPRDHH
jgi:hypothetical protein